MQSKEAYAQPILGRVTRRILDRDLNIVDVKKTKNVVTYSATNLMAKAITGDASVAISHIRIGGVTTPDYALADTNNTTFSKQTPARSDVDLYYAGNPNPGKDTVIVVPAVFLRFEGDETVDLTPDQQDSNAIFFQATLDFNTGNGYTFDELGMFGDSNTKIFSHAKVDPIGKTSAFQIEYEWSLVFR